MIHKDKNMLSYGMSHYVSGGATGIGSSTRRRHTMGEASRWFPSSFDLY